MLAHCTKSTNKHWNDMVISEGTGLTVQKMVELLTTAYGKIYGQGDTVFSSFRWVQGISNELLDY